MAIDIRLGYDVYFYKNRKKAVRPWAVDDGKYIGAEMYHVGYS